MKEKRYETNQRIIVLVLVILHTVISYLFVNFTRSIESYRDELVYYSMAKSIYYGEPLSVHGVSFGFEQLAYSFLIAPFFAISNVRVRLQAILFLNSLLLSLMLWFLWLICEELGLGKRAKWTSIIVMFVWPEFQSAATLMQENLFWPLCVLFFFFFLKYEKKPTWYNASICGFLMYVIYYCKAVGLCISLAFVFIDVFYPFFEAILMKEKVGKTYKMEWISNKKILWFILGLALFFTCRMLVGTFVYPGGAAGSADYNAGHVISNFTDIKHLVYLVMNYIAGALLGFFIVPVVAPLSDLKGMERSERKLYLYGIVLALGTMLVCAYMFGLTENYNEISPQINLRYFSACIYIFIPVFFKQIFDRGCIHTKRLLVIYLLTLIYIVLVWKGSLYVAVNAGIPLAYAKYLRYKLTLPDIIHSDIVFEDAVLVSAIAVVLVTLLWILQTVQKTRKVFPYVVTVFMIAISFLNIYCNRYFLYWAYVREDAEVDQMQQINDWIKVSCEEDPSVLYITSNWDDNESNIYDTYYDGVKSYMCSYDQIKGILLNNQGGAIAVSDMNLNECSYGDKMIIDDIDFIIFDWKTENLAGAFTNLEKIESVEGVYFSLYQNLHPSVMFVGDELTARNKVYDLTVPYENKMGQMISGLSANESGFTWTDGEWLHLTGSLSSEINEVLVSLNIMETFHGQQRVEFYLADDLLGETVVEGNDIIECIYPVAAGEYDISIHLPEAGSWYDLGFGDDRRQLGLALYSITVEGMVQQ